MHIVMRALVVALLALSLIMTAVGCEQEEVLTPTPTPTSSPSPTPTPSSRSKINLRAYVDGRSSLIISGNDVQWHHIDYAAPGRHDFNNFPTIINGIEWYPQWPDAPDEEIKHEAYSSTYSNLDPALPKEDMNIELKTIQSRSWLDIAQYPAVENDYTLIIDFDDNPPWGAAWYECELILSDPAIPTPTPSPISDVSLDYDLDTLEDLTHRVISSYRDVYVGSRSLAGTSVYVLNEPMVMYEPEGGDKVVEIYNQTLDWAEQWEININDALNETQNARSEIARIRDAFSQIEIARESGNQQEISEAYRHFNSLDPTQRTDNDDADRNGELGYVLRRLESAIMQYDENPEQGLTQLLAWCDEYSGVIERLESLGRWSSIELEWMQDDINLGLRYKEIMYEPNWGSWFHPGGFSVVAVRRADLFKLQDKCYDSFYVTSEEQNAFGQKENKPEIYLLDPDIRAYYGEILSLIDPKYRQKVQQVFEEALTSDYDLSYLNRTLELYKSYNATSALVTVANNWAKRHPELNAAAYDDLMEIISPKSATPNWDNPNYKFDPQILEWSEMLTGSREEKMQQAWKIVNDWSKTATYGGAENPTHALEKKIADCGMLTNFTISILHAHGLGGFYPFTFQNGVGGHAVVSGDIDGTLYICDPMNSGLPPMQYVNVYGDRFSFTDEMRPILQPSRSNTTHEKYYRTFEMIVSGEIFHMDTGEIERKNLPHILTSK